MQFYISTNYVLLHSIKLCFQHSLKWTKTMTARSLKRNSSR